MGKGTQSGPPNYFVLMLILSYPCFFNNSLPKPLAESSERLFNIQTMDKLSLDNLFFLCVQYCSILFLNFISNI